MNTTFTTYAEKKAKHFFNLLQGYTKGIRITAILILLLMGVNNAWGATTATLYYSVPASTVGCYSVKCYYNFGYSQTGLVEMTKVDKTSSGNLIYSVTLTADHDNVDDLLFQLFDGNTWKSQQQVMKDWTPLANNSGKMYVHDTGWKAYSTDAAYTVYFVNKDSWTGTIKAYAWNSDCDKNKDWSGADMTSTGKTYQGKNIYSITLNKRYANIIFNNGSSQTGDLTLGSTHIGKMYDGSNWVDYNVDPVVTFKANGGTGSDYTQTVKYNTSTALTENTFTRTGYTFAGWNTKTDGTGTSYTDKQKVTLKANTTLYAKWTANAPSTTTVTFKSEPAAACDLKVNSAAFTSGSTFEVGTTDYVTLTVEPKDGYKWLGFNYNNNEINVTTNGAYSIKVKSNGTTAATTITVNFQELLSTETIYLKPGGWNSDNARFAVYVYNATENKWIDMEPVGCTGYYKTKEIIDAKYTGITFCRMDPTKTDNVWENRWNQTAGKNFDGTWNCFEHTTWGNVGDNGYQGGEDCSGNYTTYTPSDPTITLSNGANGVLSVKTMDDVEITNGSTVPMDTRVVVTVTPNAGYMVNSAIITIGDNQETVESGKTYTICNNTTITTSYTEAGEWYVFGTMNEWNAEERHKIVNGKAIVSLNGDTEYSFKIVQVKGTKITYYGKEWTVTGLNKTITSLSSTDGTPDCKINTVHKGDYIFEWDANSRNLIVTYPNMCFIRGDFDGWKDRASHALHDRDAQVYLEKNNTYYFKIVEQGVYYTDKNQYTTLLQKTGDKKTMNDNTSYGMDDSHNCGITATITGIYKFHFDRTTRELTVTYPTEDKTLATGDYRLKFENGTYNHVSDHAKKRDGEQILSMFIKNAGTTPRIILQRCTNASGSGTWEDVATYNLSTMSTVTSDQEMTNEYGGVWNFIIKQTNGGANAEVIIDETHPERYTGNYYIRTDAAGGGWNEYQIPENVMPFASYPRDNGKGFDHYFCEWILNGKNVNYNIANDYCSKLCPDDFTKDDYTTDQGHLQADANVRFMWDSRTNNMKGRAYLSGSNTIGDRFLVLIGDANLKDIEGNTFNISGLNQHETNFADKQNWVYQVDVKANNNTLVKLTAKYNGQEQYFEGGAGQDEKIPLINATKNEDYKIRLIYNFKTDHLVRAWLVGDVTIENTETLGADMMIIRRNQEQAQQLKFDPNSSTLSEVKTVFAVTTFSKAFITDESKSQYERALYWVSFPFDVKISDVFGFGEYGDHWIIQYYDGEARAQKGLFSDSGTYWRYITDRNATLEKNKGYVLTLDLDRVKGSFLHGSTEVNLYFPSTVNLEIITGLLPKEVTVDEHTCTINMPDATPENKRDRRIYDSHWNMIGVPVFADVENFPTKPGWTKRENGNLSFYYEYLPATNSYQATNETADFQTLYGYMVQFAGTIKWYENTVEFPKEMAARRNADNTNPELVSLRLEIAQGEEKADQTFVQLQQEGATSEFDMNLDLTKIINSGANIYTLAGEQRIQSAGNALPMEEALVPVGVQIAAEGEYTFRMPDGTEDMVVELIDYERDITTNLLLFDYTVTLPAGSNESRFALHIQPNKSGVTTGVENVGDKAKGIEKYLIDGKLVIRTAEGAVYDAQGHVVQ